MQEIHYSYQMNFYQLSKLCYSSPTFFSFWNSGYAYYGEYPLAFAACLGNTDIYDFLLQHGADPDLQDSFGNTVLHMVVIADQAVSIYLRVNLVGLLRWSV